MSGYNIQYVTAGDGTVVAWGEENDPPGRETRWGASAWTSHPYNEDARHIDRLAADTTYSDVQRVVGEYLAEHRAPNA